MDQVSYLNPPRGFGMYSYADACVVARFQSLDKECSTYVVAQVWASVDDETPPVILPTGYTVTDNPDLYCGAVSVATFRNGSRTE